MTTATRVAVVVAVLAAVGAGQGVAAAEATRSGPGAAVVATRRLDARLLELTVRTPALAAETRVRVLLPTGYAAAPRRRYPVLYLLHGASDDAGGVDALRRRRAADRRQAADRRHARRRARGLVHELVPGRQGRPAGMGDLPRRPARSGSSTGGSAPSPRAAAGRSPASPWAASARSATPRATPTASPPRRASPAASTWRRGSWGSPAGPVVVDATAAQDGGRPGSVFGDFTTQGIRWRGHNPPDLAVNLRGLALTLRTGNGQPGGPFGGGRPRPRSRSARTS